MEDVEVLESLTGGGEHDRLADDPGDGQRRAAAGVTVEFGEDDPVEADSLLEGHGGVDGILSDHGVDDEERLVGVGHCLDVGSLGHEFLVNAQTTSGVDDDDVVELALCLGDGVLGHLDRVADAIAGFGGEDLHPGPLPDHLQLGDGIGTLEVAGGKHRGVPLRLEPCGELAGQGRLAGTLQTSKHDDRWRILRESDGTRLATQDVDEFLVDDLDDLLGGIERLGQFLTTAAFLDGCDEFLDNTEVDVGLEQRDTDLPSRGIDVSVSETTFSTQPLERGCETVLQSVEHG